MNFVLAIHPAFFMDTSLTPQYDKKCPSLRAVFLKNGVAIYVDLGKFFWGLGFVGTLGKFVILSIAKYPKNLRCTLILWILRFLAKAQYDNFIDMTNLGFCLNSK